MSFLQKITASFKSLSIVDIILMVILIIVVISIIAYLLALNNIENVESFVSDQTISVSGSEVSGHVGGDPIDMNTTKPLEDMSPQDVYFVLVYDNACPHCVNFKPTWNTVSGRFNGSTLGSKKITFYQVGGDQASVRQKFVQDYNVSGFPTVLVMRKDGEEIKAKEYEGERGVEAFSSFISTSVV